MIYHRNNAFVQRIQNGHASSANGDLQMLGISADMRKQKSASPPLEAERASQNTESLTELAATESKEKLIQVLAMDPDEIPKVSCGLY